MTIKEVVHLVCDDAHCEGLPCMTFEEAVSHAEMHKAQKFTLLAEQVKGD